MTILSSIGHKNMHTPDQDQFAHPPSSKDERRQRILEGLADADAGRLIPHEEVVRWAQKLPNIPDLSPEAIEIIRDANRYLEDDYKPTCTLIPGL